MLWIRMTVGETLKYAYDISFLCFVAVSFVQMVQVP